MIGFKINIGEDWLTKDHQRLVRVLNVDSKNVTLIPVSEMIPNFTISRKEFRERYNKFEGLILYKE